MRYDTLSQLLALFHKELCMSVLFGSFFAQCMATFHEVLMTTVHQVLVAQLYMRYLMYYSISMRFGTIPQFMETFHNVVSIALIKTTVLY